MPKTLIWAVSHPGITVQGVQACQRHSQFLADQLTIFQPEADSTFTTGTPKLFQLLTSPSPKQSRALSRKSIASTSTLCQQIYRQWADVECMSL